MIPRNRIHKISLYKILKNSDYIKINLIFTGIIIAIMVYSGIFSVQNPHPIPSAIKAPVISTGLSRAFSEIIRLNFNAALAYNPYSLKLFSFFLFQGFLRIIVSILLFRNIFSKKLILFADILLSVLLFLWSFGRFIIDQVII